MNKTLDQAAAAVEFVGVSKIYGTTFKAIDTLDFNIQPGEFLTLLGPSGSGKTTALNLLAGFQTVTSGKILLDGKDIGALPPHKRNIGVVFQHYALFPHMSVAQNIAYPLQQRRVAKSEIERRVAEVMRMVSLEAYADRLPRQLSGGQQQRVAVARAIVFRPRLLLMDEPLGALDRKLRESVQLELKRIHRDLGVTIVFVTHDQEEALVMSDRIAIFDRGRIQQIGTAEELYDRPTTQFVAQFLGDTNCFVGQVTIANGLAQVDGPDGILVGTKSATTPETGRAAMLIRPERCALFPRNGAPLGWNAVDVRVRETVYLGSLTKVLTELPSGATATVVSHPGSTMPGGNELTIGFPIDAGQIVPTMALDLN